MEQTRNDQLSAKDAPPKLSCEASRNSWIDGWSKETEAPKNCFSRRFSNKIQITRHIALAVSKFGTKAKSILIFLCLARLDREFEIERDPDGSPKMCMRDSISMLVKCY